MSRFGSWIERDGLPAFAYTADHHALPEAEWDTRVDGVTRRHWVGIGNRRLQVFVDNEGTAAVYDEADGMRWLVAPEPHGSGVSRIEEAGGARWASRFDERPAGSESARTIGPTWFEVAAESPALRLERTILCPEGESPWLLVRVRLTAKDAPVRLRHVEEWQLRPRFLNLLAAQAGTAAEREALRRTAESAVGYAVETAPGLVRARERHDAAQAFAPVALTDGRSEPMEVVFGPEHTLLLQALGSTHGEPEQPGGDPHPALRLATDVELDAGASAELWFRFGIDDGSACEDPAALFEQSLGALRERLPSGSSTHAPQAARELAWNAALLTGGACVDNVLGGHTLNEAGAYSFQIGTNLVARDPFQHALPLVYCEPALAWSVLRNTLGWGGPDGRLGHILDGAKHVRDGVAWGSLQCNEHASDLNLWSLWLAAELAAATGDLDQFAAELAFHPKHDAAPVPVWEHLRRGFVYLRDSIGRGPSGLLRIQDADWSDGDLGDIASLGLDREQLVARGESVLSSAMATWVLPVFAGLADRLGDAETATAARLLANELRDAVAATWNGRWYKRAFVGDVAIGDDTLFLEVQTWAILGGVAEPARARELLRTVDEILRVDSPLGARRRWPLTGVDNFGFAIGEGLRGGHWPSLQGTLVWAAARHDPELAWDEWRRMTLTNHGEAYPDVWEGTLSGPDSYNGPEAAQPGRSWALGGGEVSISMQSFPVNNLHSHSQLLLGYLRLLGVEPAADGALQVGGASSEGASFASRTFALREDGSGRLEADGAVTVRAARGEARSESGAGSVEW